MYMSCVPRERRPTNVGEGASFQFLASSVNCQNPHSANSIFFWLRDAACIAAEMKRQLSLGLSVAKTKFSAAPGNGISSECNVVLTFVSPITPSLPTRTPTTSNLFPTGGNKMRSEQAAAFVRAVHSLLCLPQVEGGRRRMFKI